LEPCIHQGLADQWVSLMPSNPLDGIALEQDEHIVRQWAVDAVELDGVEGPRGWFILTNRRCLFARREGLLGSRASLDASRSVRLEAILYAGVRHLPMHVGLGEQGSVLGLELDGRGYRTGRSTPPGGVLVAIARERLTRRVGLGLANDAQRCGACGTQSFPWSTACPYCGHALGAAGPDSAGSPSLAEAGRK
jgi:hypothetical protein